MPKNSPNLRSVEYECRTRNAYARCTAPTHTKKRGNTVQTNGVYRTKSVPGSGLAARAVCLFPCHAAASSSKSDLTHDTVGFLHSDRVLPSSRKAASIKPPVEAPTFFPKRAVYSGFRRGDAKTLPYRAEALPGREYNAATNWENGNGDEYAQIRAVLWRRFAAKSSAGRGPIAFWLRRATVVPDTLSVRAVKLRR